MKNARFVVLTALPLLVLAAPVSGQDIYLPLIWTEGGQSNNDQYIELIVDQMRAEGIDEDSISVVRAELEAGGEPNGLGNVIIGYNEQRVQTANDRSGSHMLVVGKEHNYSAFGGIVVGLTNTTGGE